MEAGLHRFMDRLDRVEWSHWTAALLGGVRIRMILIGAWILIAVPQRDVRELRERIVSRIPGADAARRAATPWGGYFAT